MHRDNHRRTTSPPGAGPRRQTPRERAAQQTRRTSASHGCPSALRYYPTRRRREVKSALRESPRFRGNSWLVGRRSHKGVRASLARAKRRSRQLTWRGCKAAGRNRSASRSPTLQSRDAGTARLWRVGPRGAARLSPAWRPSPLASRILSIEGAWGHTAEAPFRPIFSGRGNHDLYRGPLADTPTRGSRIRCKRETKVSESAG